LSHPNDISIVAYQGKLFLCCPWTRARRNSQSRLWNVLRFRSEREDEISETSSLHCILLYSWYLYPTNFRKLAVFFFTDKACKGIHINLGSSIAKQVPKLKSSIAKRVEKFDCKFKYTDKHIFINLCNNCFGFLITFKKKYILFKIERNFHLIVLKNGNFLFQLYLEKDGKVFRHLCKTDGFVVKKTQE